MSDPLQPVQSATGAVETVVTETTDATTTPPPAEAPEPVAPAPEPPPPAPEPSAPAPEASAPAPEAPAPAPEPSAPTPPPPALEPEAPAPSAAGAESTVDSASTTSQQTVEPVTSTAQEATGGGSQPPDVSQTLDGGASAASGASEPVTQAAQAVVPEVPGTDPFVGTSDAGAAAAQQVVGASGAPADLAGGVSDPVIQTTSDPVVQHAVGGTGPVLEPVSFDVSPGVLDLPPHLDPGGGGLDSALGGIASPAVDPILETSDPLAGAAGSLPDGVGGAVQTLVAPADTLAPALPGGVDPALEASDPLTGAAGSLPDGVGGAVQTLVAPAETLAPALPGVDPALQTSDPLAGAGGSLPDGVGGALQPLVEPAETLAPALPGLDPSVGLPDPALQPLLATSDPLTGAGGSLPDGVGAAVQPLVEPATTLAPALPGSIDPGADLPNPALQPLLGASDPLAGAAGSLPDGVGAAVQPLAEPATTLAPALPGGLDPGVGLPGQPTDSFVSATDPVVQPVFGAGEPHGIGEAVRSFFDAIAGAFQTLGLSPTSSADARIAALVVLLGVTAARFASTASAFAGYAVAGVNMSVRSAWLTSWDSARCLVTNASRGKPGSLGSGLFGSGRSSAFMAGSVESASAGGKAGGILSVLAGQGPARPFDKPAGAGGMLGRTGDSGFRRFLGVLLLVATGLLGLAALPGRVLQRREIVLLPARVRVSLAAVAVSVLLAVGIVLLVAP